MNRPEVARRDLDCLASLALGARVVTGLLAREGVHAEDESMSWSWRAWRRPRERTFDRRAHPVRIAGGPETAEMGEPQRRQIARMLVQDRLPGGDRVIVGASTPALQRLEMQPLALGGCGRRHRGDRDASIHGIEQRPERVNGFAPLVVMSLVSNSAAAAG